MRPSVAPLLTAGRQACYGLADRWLTNEVGDRDGPHQRGTGGDTRTADVQPQRAPEGARGAVRRRAGRRAGGSARRPCPRARPATPSHRPTPPAPRPCRRCPPCPREASPPAPPVAQPAWARADRPFERDARRLDRPAGRLGARARRSPGRPGAPELRPRGPARRPRPRLDRRRRRRRRHRLPARHRRLARLDRPRRAHAARRHALARRSSRAGIWLYERQGRTDASLATLSAGIAGLFTTVAVGGPVYEVLPVAAALALALGTGALATYFAMRWESRGIGALGIVGALMAPVLAGAPSTGATLALLWVAAASGAAVLVWQRWNWLAFAVFADRAAQWVWWLGTEPAARRDPARARRVRRGERRGSRRLRAAPARGEAARRPPPCC